MAELIQKQDTLNEGRVKLNAAITDAEQAKVTAVEADSKATQALANSESTQTQLDTIVINGDSSVEAAQARVDEKGVGHTTLKDRIDDGFTKVTSQLNDIAVNVKSFGAKGDGVTDDTEAIQSAIDYVESLGGGTVIVPPGNYMIKAHDENTSSPNYLRDEGGLSVKTGVNFELVKGAKLLAIANSERAYNIVRFYKVRNASITGGGTIEGERDKHGGTSGEYGYGIFVCGSKDITISNLTINNCWGDGIDLKSYTNSNGVRENNERVTISNVLSDNNRRQGLSVESCINLLVKDSTFSNTNGTPPSCGIDIEPLSGEAVDNVTIVNCLLDSNNSAGIMVLNTGSKNIKIDNCTFRNNKDTEAPFKTNKGVKNVTIQGCTFDGNSSIYGVILQDGVNFNVLNNSFLDCGIDIRGGSNNSIENVSVVNNSIEMEYVRLSIPEQAKNIRITGNILKGRMFNENSRLTVSGSNVILSNNEFTNFTRMISFNGKNISVRANLFIRDLEFDMNEGVVNIQGQVCLVKNNEFVRYRRGIALRGKNNSVIDNEIHGSGTEASLIDGENAVFKGNLITGACHSNEGARPVRINNASEKSVTVAENVFYQDPFVEVTGNNKVVNMFTVSGGGNIEDFTLENNYNNFGGQ